MSHPGWRFTAEQLRAAEGRTIRDVLAPDLRVVFCGINPGLMTALVGHHFAHPANRFWKALHASGFTDRLLHPSEERELLRYRLGLTNVVARATAAASDLAPDDFRDGGRVLVRKVKRHRPRVLAVLGVGAYRLAFERPRAVVGPQPETIGDTHLWVLPNPSGLNANYRPGDIARLFAELRASVGD